jgi:hypothetical protein
MNPQTTDEEALLAKRSRNTAEEMRLWVNEQNNKILGEWYRNEASGLGYSISPSNGQRQNINAIVDELLDKHRALTLIPLSKDQTKMMHFIMFLLPPLEGMISAIEEEFSNKFGVRFLFGTKKTFIRAIVQKRHKTVSRQLHRKLETHHGACFFFRDNVDRPRVQGWPSLTVTFVIGGKRVSGTFFFNPNGVSSSGTKKRKSRAKSSPDCFKEGDVEIKSESLFVSKNEDVNIKLASTNGSGALAESFVSKNEDVNIKLASTNGSGALAESPSVPPISCTTKSKQKKAPKPQIKSPVIRKNTCE